MIAGGLAALVVVGGASLSNGAQGSPDKCRGVTVTVTENNRGDPIGPGKDLVTTGNGRDVINLGAGNDKVD